MQRKQLFGSILARVRPASDAPSSGQSVAERRQPRSQHTQGNAGRCSQVVRAPPPVECGSKRVLMTGLSRVCVEPSGGFRDVVATAGKRFHREMPIGQVSRASLAEFAT